jgi:hypothetical protein
MDAAGVEGFGEGQIRQDGGEAAGHRRVPPPRPVIEQTPKPAR